MNRPVTGEDDERVENLDDFAAFLLAQSADAADATGSGTWLNNTIEDFLGAIAALLAPDGVDPSASAAEVAVPEPTTWNELATLLYNARSHQPASPAATNDLLADAKSVGDRVELFTYIRWLIKDLQQDRAELAERTRLGQWAGEGRWAHWVLSNWFESWGRWLCDAYLKPLPPLMVKLGIAREPIEPVSYRSIAIQLSGARIYE